MAKNPLLYFHVTLVTGRGGVMNYPTVSATSRRQAASSAIGGMADQILILVKKYPAASLFREKATGDLLLVVGTNK